MVPMTSAPESPERASDPAPAVGMSDDPHGLLGRDGLRPVSEKLIPARYVAAAFWYVVALLLVAGAIVLASLTDIWWLAPIGLLPLILMLQSLVLTPRRVRAIGYRDAEEDLTVASGIMFREVHTIPYGRVQSVKIDEGPVDRRYGLAKLTMSTAAAGTDVTLAGLPKDEAERLRELLTDRGISTMAAL